ncbi:enoyl-CoA hydratase/carnithine racemase [Povalibacter uvarum]|uniref:Enoyl-CoA hydratase/carnithine racemase n=1 Tax=Povalibacter uvarum TaxID=732238 RepID=A0A841HJJ4_9GAMM|nr:enoyl-CoA hydratase-related protein [Povalibacter uvarum]MBB6092195.1 enoyl-CoA hydratase/carnithine racemase [Povalibacter uvarum]
MTEHIRVTVEDRVMRIAFNRPEKKNAITNAMYVAMGEALTRAESDPQIRAVLFEAEGDAFTAGNDLADFAAVAAGKMARSEMKAHVFLEALARGQKPYVAAVQGFAVGVGVTMLMHCDLVYIADDAKLTTPFVNLALVPEAASSWLIPARIGHARAFAMFALGEPVDGRTAASIGIANASLPVSEVRAKAWAAAQALASRPLGAVQATKKLMRDAAAISAVMSREGEIFGQRLQTAEAAEAFRAFAERRAPDFSKVSG